MITMIPEILSNNEVLMDKKSLDLNSYDEIINSKDDKSPSNHNYQEVLIEGYSILAFETLDDLNNYSSKCQKSCDDGKNKSRRKKRHLALKRNHLENTRNEFDSESENRKLEAENSPKAKRIKLKLKQIEDLSHVAKTPNPIKKRPIKRSLTTPPSSRPKITVKRRSKSVNDIGSLIAPTIPPKAPNISRNLSKNISPFKKNFSNPQNAELHNVPLKQTSSPKVVSEEIEPSNNILSRPEMIQSLSKLLNISVEDVKNLIRNPAFIKLYRISLAALSKQQEFDHQETSATSAKPHPPVYPQKEDQKLATSNNFGNIGYSPSMIKRMNFPRPNTQFPGPMTHAANYFKPKAPLVHIQNGIRTRLDSNAHTNFVPRSIILMNEKSEPMLPLNLSVKKSQESSPKRFINNKNNDPKKINFLKRFDDIQLFMKNNNSNAPSSSEMESTRMQSPKINLSNNASTTTITTNNNNLTNCSNRIPSAPTKKTPIKWCDAHVRIAYNIYYANAIQKNPNLMQPRLNTPLMNKTSDPSHLNHPQMNANVNGGTLPSHRMRLPKPQHHPAPRMPANGRGIGQAFPGTRAMPPVNNAYINYRNSQNFPKDSQPNKVNSSMFNPSTVNNHTNSPSNSHNNNGASLYPNQNGNSHPVNGTYRSLQRYPPFPSGPVNQSVPHPFSSQLSPMQNHLPPHYDVNSSSGVSMEQYYHIFQEFCKNLAQRTPDPSQMNNNHIPSVGDLHENPQKLPFPINNKSNNNNNSNNSPSFFP